MPRKTRRLLSLLVLAAPLGAVLAVAQAPDNETPERWAMESGGVYAGYCSGCHGERGEGASASSLIDDDWVYGGADDQIARSIRDGRPGTAMVAFREVLEEEQIQRLVGFVRMLDALADFRRPRPHVDPDGTLIRSEKHALRVEVVARDLWGPWGLEFLPDGSMLISDRRGDLRVVEDGTLRPDPLRGTPTPWIVQDGGSFDIAVHPDYGKTGWVYLAYAEPGPDNVSTSERGPGNTSMTTVVRGRIRDGHWVDQEVLFRAPSLFAPRDLHYGSRFLFLRDGTLLFSIGDRGAKARAQDLSSPLGKVHRINDDGSVPGDNPFVARQGALPTVWTWGHRNPQGLSIDPLTGDLWESEHGPIGGDEINVLDAGRNYGWPVISNGIEPGTVGSRHEGMESPVGAWIPSIAPSGIAFYTGDRFPRWRNDLFVTALRGQALRRLEVRNRQITHEEVVLRDIGRVRDVTTGPDGLLYVALERREGFELTRPLGLVLRLVPAEAQDEG